MGIQRLSDQEFFADGEGAGGRRLGSVDGSAERRYLVIGRIVRAHGVRGEMRTAILTQLPERFTWLERVYLSHDVDDSAPRERLVESVRFHQKYVLLKVEDVDTRDDVESLRGHWVLVPEEEAISLEEGEVFFFELEGLAVHTEEGEHLGRLVEVLETGANEVFVVRGEQGEVLLPNTEEVVLEVDIDAGKMVVRLLPGLLA